MRARRIALLSLVAVLAGAAPAAAAPGQSKDDPLPATVGTPVTAALGPGGDVWFRVTTDRPGTWSATTQGSDVDVRLEALVFDGGLTVAVEPASPDAAGVLAGPLPAGTGLVHLRSLEADRAGTARLLVREGAAPEDDVAAPVELDLGAGSSGVATASRGGATTALQPGEPGGADERSSVWFALTAPATGPIWLDMCLPASDATGATAGVLRVLADDPAAPLGGRVLAERRTTREAGGRAACGPVRVDATAGARYRVQATTTDPGVPYEQAVVLRARAAASAPAVTTTPDRDCSTAACSEAIEALPAPDRTITALDCRVDAGAFAPCPVVDGRPRTPEVPLGSVATVAVRAMDDAGRVATTRTTLGRFLKGAPPVPQVLVAVPGVGTQDLPAPRPGTTPTAPPASTPAAAIPTPTARFAVAKRGTRVRSLVARGVPAGTRVTVTCRGAGCPRGAAGRSSRTAARAGQLDLRTVALRRATLRPGARLTVTIAAPGRAARSVRWMVRAGRAPARAVR